MCFSDRQEQLKSTDVPENRTYIDEVFLWVLFIGGDVRLSDTPTRITDLLGCNSSFYLNYMGVRLSPTTTDLCPFLCEELLGIKKRLSGRGQALNCSLSYYSRFLFR